MTATTTTTDLPEAPRSSSSRAQPAGAGWDWWLLAVTCALLAFGLVMQYSASAVMAAEKLGDHLYLVKSQGLKIAVGFALMLVAMKVDYRWWRRLVYPLLGVGLVGLVLVAIPGIGHVHNGARRWFSLGGMSYQPVEMVKVIAVIYLAYSVSKKGERMGSFTVGFLPHLAMIGLMVGLLLLQPDFGSSVILVTMMGIMLFVSGARILYLGVFALLGVVGAAVVVARSEYRMRRILAFLDPWSYRSDIGYQISESLIAIGSGGLQGRGLGQGHGKLGYVPELWNDFIGTIVAEELGLVGVIVLVALFALLIGRGLKAAFEAVDDFGRYLAFGLTTLIALQATANLCGGHRPVTDQRPDAALRQLRRQRHHRRAVRRRDRAQHQPRGARCLGARQRPAPSGPRAAALGKKKRRHILRRREDLRGRFDG